jgi:multidrug transporter EmrE-like cation transporter
MDNPWTNLLLLCLVEAYGDFKFKAYARSNNDVDGVPLFIKGCAGYAGVIYFLIRMLRLKDVIWVNAMWDGGSALIETLFAYFMFGERLKQPVNYAGLALIVLGLFMLRNG